MTNRTLNITVKFLLLHIFDVEVFMDSPLPKTNYIISANHLNWLDPILITLAWPSEVFMMYIGPRQAVTNTGWKRWFIGGMSQVILTPQRSGWLGKEAYQQVLRGLTAGHCLLIFPEGDAFPQEGVVMPYAHGVAHFALLTGIPVVPVGICGTADLYYRKKLIVRIGAPIEVPRAERVDKKLLGDSLTHIRDATRLLIEGYQDPIVASKPMHWLTHLM